MEAAVDIIQAIVTFVCEPKLYFFLCSIWCIVSFTKPQWWIGEGTSLKANWKFALMMGIFIFLYVFSIATSADFRKIAFKGDNIPIILMLFLIVYFTWLATWRGHQNDLRRARGHNLIEEDESEVKVLVWPHLLYIEFIVGVFVTALLLVWSITIMAPLEEPAASARTPNPSKAPWYFLGLQEMLVYFDPWMAGVVAPSLIILGLMALPYIDKNPKGNGYYTIAERRFAITGFSYGFLVLWISLILLGTVFRGPNWNFFGPYDYWDPHMQPVLNNVNLSEIIFIKILGQGLPEHWLAREWPGLLLAFGYVAILPVALKKLSIFRDIYERSGAARYYTFMLLFLGMLSLPIKMLLRWSINLKYLIYIPDYFFNL